MSPTIHRKYKYFHSTVQTAEDRRQKVHFCRLPFDINVVLNLSTIPQDDVRMKKLVQGPVSRRSRKIFAPEKP